MTFAVTDSSNGGTGIQVVANGKVIINSMPASSPSSGVNLANGTHNNLGKESVITVQNNSSAQGLVILDKSTSATPFTADSLSIKVNAKDTARGINVYAPTMGANINLTGSNVVNVITSNANKTAFSYGMFITGNKTNKAKLNAEQIHLKVTGSGETVHGINIQPNATVSIGSSTATSRIEVESGQSTAIVSFGDAFIGNNLYISAKGQEVKAVQGVFISNGTLELNNSSINSQGIGITLNNTATVAKLSHVVINAGYSHAVSAQSSSSVIELDNTELNLTASSASGAGIWSVLGGTVKANNTKITSDRVGVMATQEGKIELSGNTSIEAGTGIAIRSTNTNSVVNTGASGSKMNIIGNIQADNGGLVKLAMTDNSYFKGAAQSTGATLDLAMANSLWDMTTSSTVNGLVLHNTRINYAQDTSSVLQVDELSGNGQLHMAVDMAAQRGQLLRITHSTAGQFKLAINNNGAANTKGTEQLVVADTADGGDFTLAHQVEAGGYRYGLRRDAANANNWQLYATGKLTTTAQAAAGDFLNAAYLLNYIGTQTLLQRMGELRNSQEQNGGFWIRGFAGKLNSFSGNKLAGYAMDYNGYQLGVDKLITLARGNLYIGAMVGYTHANSDYSEGTGTVKDYNSGVYATYLDKSGIYLDAVAKYLYIKNDFKVHDTAATQVKGTGRQQGYSLSVETGKRWPIAQTNFYLEPQTQLTYSQLGGVTSNASNGLKVNLQGYESVLGRASLVVGYQLNSKDNPVFLYIKSGYVRE